MKNSVKLNNPLAGLYPLGALFFVVMLLSTQCSGQIVTTICGNGGVFDTSGNGGPAVNAGIYGPHALTYYQGKLLVSGYYTRTIREIDLTTGTINHYAGSAYATSLVDSLSAQNADFEQTNSIIVAKNGDIYTITPRFNKIAKISASTGLVSIVVGRDTNHYSGDGGPAENAGLDVPGQMAIDTAGNLFFTDFFNSRVRKIDANTGIITTVAGNGLTGFTGDGGLATDARVGKPYGVAVDSAGNLYISDKVSRIRKVDGLTHIITTLAGNDTSDYGGDNGPATSAKLKFPGNMTIDRDGNLLVADPARLRKIDLHSGIITTVAGGVDAGGFSGDSGLAVNAAFYRIGSIAVDDNRNIYICDEDNHRIRKISYADTSHTGIAKANGLAELNLKVYPNPAYENISLTFVSTDQQLVSIEIFNIAGAIVYNRLITAAIGSCNENIDCHAWPNGIYFVKVKQGITVVGKQMFEVNK